ncbi:MAG: hypothetical protein U9P63_01910 [Patescibacteria group bacterium]|nr:hypothetical protein [Patescibacteria group bacterium]
MSQKVPDAFFILFPYFVKRDKKHMTNAKQKLILITAILALIGAIVWTYDYITKIETDHISESAVEEEKQSKKETEKEEAQESVLSEAVWSKYINDELGFSIDIPDKTHGQYSCEPKKIIQVPVKVFEDNENGIVYISQEYYYQSKYDSALRKYTGECKKIIYSLELFRNKYQEWRDSFLERPRGFNPRLGWAIMIKTARNEDELDKFIKENYGSGCYAKDKKLLGTDYEQPGVYDISIGGEGDSIETTLGTTSCVGAWIERYKVLYFPEENKVMSVILGQEPTFWNNPHTPPYQAYDEKMINSFRFE